MPLPPLNLSASSGAQTGPGTASGSFLGGTVNFGGSGMGGSATGNGLNVGGLVTQYWPILAVVAAVVYLRRRKK